MTSAKYLAAKEVPKDAPVVKSTNPFDNLDRKPILYHLLLWSSLIALFFQTRVLSSSKG